MTFEELKTRVPDPEALEERAAIIEFESTPKDGPKPSRMQAEVAAVLQWLEAEREKKQGRMF
jgi:hypothetical protein